jgi:uncharacterized protein (TIGR02598 family)
MKSKGPAGFSLVEVTLALGLIVFCLLTLMALLPVGVKSNQESIQQTAAANFAAAIAADLKNTEPGMVSALFGLTRPAAAATAVSSQTLYLDENGTRSGTVGASTAPSGARYRVLVEATPPGTAASVQAVMLRIRLVWPAPAKEADITGVLEVMTALERS